ncbi:MAG: glycosyl transferase [Alkalinema sp. CACIAM 70d]|nr:MAG: glycosyl transferase [Alkalinema sp. CACIAM 70d]
MKKLAIVLSHPIQYYAPWFRHLHADPEIQLKVFYLWNFGVSEVIDRGFGQKIQWDIPLLEGYDHEFVANTSSNPGTHHIWGLKNPTLIPQIRAYEPDTVLLMNYNYASLYHFLWHWQDCPILFRGDSHRIMPERGIKAWLRQQWITQVYQHFDRILYVGKANYHYFRTHGVAAEKLFFSPHTIDNDRFMAQTDLAHEQAKLWKQELGIPENHKVILFAGKFIPKKRPIDLVNAFVQANLADTSLLLVGAGALESDLRTLAAQHSQIYFAPFQNQSFMPRTYAIADVFVLPSYGNSETWGLAVNEAMCLGKPIIVSDHVGCAKDLVRPGHNGFIFPAGNVEALAQCLQQMLASPATLAIYGEASRQLIQNYSYVQASQGLKQAMNIAD